MDEREKGKMHNQIERIVAMTDHTFNALINVLKQSNNEEVIDAFVQLKQELNKV